VGAGRAPLPLRHSFAPIRPPRPAALPFPGAAEPDQGQHRDEGVGVDRSAGPRGGGGGERRARGGARGMSSCRVWSPQGWAYPIVHLGTPCHGGAPGEPRGKWGGSGRAPWRGASYRNLGRGTMWETTSQYCSVVQRGTRAGRTEWASERDRRKGSGGQNSTVP